MKIIVANRDDYIDYFSKRTDTLNVSVLNEQENYIIHSIEFETGENDVSLMYSSINNLLDEQYEKDNYIKVEELKEIDSLFHTLNKDQCKIINAYAEVNHYTINSLDEIKELIANINDYQILEKYNLEEVGKLLTEKSPEYEVSDEMQEFINYSKLAERYLFDSNIKEDFCSYGLLVNTRKMLDNDLIEEKLEENKILKITFANKKQFEETPFCNQATICLPTDQERIKEKLEQIGLDYENLSNEDTHITFCKLLNFDNEKLSDGFDFLIEKMLEKLVQEQGKTTSLQEIELLCNELEKFDNIRMNKFIAIIEAKENEITNFNEIIGYAKNTEKYEVIYDVKNFEDLGKYLVNETGHFDDVSLLSNYINYEKLAEDYTREGCTYNGDFTHYGYLIKKEEFEIVNKKENEEEEEME